MCVFRVEFHNLSGAVKVFTCILHDRKIFIHFFSIVSSTKLVK